MEDTSDQKEQAHVPAMEYSYNDVHQGRAD